MIYEFAVSVPTWLPNPRHGPLVSFFFVFQFSRTRLRCYVGAIVASLSRLRRSICGKVQSITYVAAEFIEGSTRCASLKAIDFSATSGRAIFHLQFEIRRNPSHVISQFRNFHFYATCRSSTAFCTSNSRPNNTDVRESLRNISFTLYLALNWERWGRVINLSFWDNYLM